MKKAKFVPLEEEEDKDELS